MATRIKICGITRQDDAEAAVRAGADMVGLNFVPGSPRHLALPAARVIAEGVRGSATCVGVFANACAGTVRGVLDRVALNVLQFHGEETGEFCGSFGLPFLKVLRVRAPLDLAMIEAEYASAQGLLLDAYVPGQAGGTGRRFDWSLWPERSQLPLLLAGGLTPENVAEAVTRLAPWGVDVSGGVEGPSKGIKDHDRIRRFIDEVHRARS